MKPRDNLVEKKHWDDIYTGNFNFSSRVSNSKLFQSYYHFALFSIISRFLRKDEIKSVIEVGCAPGNYLVKFKKYFGLVAYGLEYSKKGYQKTVKNLEKYGIPSENIFLNDFFDDDFLAKNKEKYDVAFSTGFIEHFDHPEDVVLRHGDLIRPGGLVICLIPNKRYLNAFFTSKKSLALHNREIMSKKELGNIFKKSSFLVLYCNYFGGIFNVGLFQAKNPIVKIVHNIVFIFQRIFLDILQKIYFKLTRKDLVSKFSSPSLICIAKKS